MSVKEAKCPACDGFGWRVELGVFHYVQESCPSCKGTGRTGKEVEAQSGMRVRLSALVQWLRQRSCNHSSYIEDITRCAEGGVACHCLKCGKRLTAEYGLALETNWQTKPLNEKVQ